MSEPTTLPETATLPATRPAGPAGTVPMGLMPSTLEDGWRLAQLLAKSGLVPEDFRGKPENVLVALQLGAEVGFPPMQALQSIAIINGRPSIWGDGFLALLINSRPYRSHDEYFEVAVLQDVNEVGADGKVHTVKKWIMERREGLVVEDWKRDDTAAVCSFWRKDRPNPTTVRFTVGQAKKAGLLSKSGTWQTYPDRMLKMRARSWAGRDAFPDVLRGLSTAEESGDVVMDVPPPPQEPRRASAATVTEVPQAKPAAVDQVKPEGAGEIVTLDNVLVKHTAFIKPQTAGVEPYFLITVIRNETRAPIELITRDEPTYKEAAAREGTDDRFRIEYVAQADAGRVITRIEPLDQAPPADLLS
jgi:hypothetical protein